MQWRTVIDEYVRLRDLERTDFQRDLQRLVADLKRDAAALYGAGLRQEVRGPEPEGFIAADYTSAAILRRLAASEFTDRHLRFTDAFLDRLEGRVPRQVQSLRSQAWWLDAAAEIVLVWTETYERRRDELAALARESGGPGRREQRNQGRGPSVGLDCLIGGTLECTTAEIAEQLVEAGVDPERENEENDPLMQWKGHLKKARQRYRQRYAD